MHPPDRWDHNPYGSLRRRLAAEVLVHRVETEPAARAASVIEACVVRPAGWPGMV